MSMIGKTLGNFKIASQLGKGGMGEVYLAKDQRLGRDVAIKVLPEEFARDTDRVARFQREAKLLASLNHPNIASIYGLEESDGTNFLVLELIEGDTLADRIVGAPGRASEDIKDILRIALQIADALEAAHEKGVIHRDLKPANIKITPDGNIKVLDFGLAKAFAEDPEEVNLSHSPTLSAAATQQGVILGTAAYMSPEQAKGKSIDKRTDIWAFGCVLYEMLTGEAAFQGEDVTEILAAVVKLDANMNLLPANVHPRVREVLSRCLQKDLKNRYRDIGEAQFEIKQVLADPSGVFVQPAAAAKPRKKIRFGLPWIAAALVLGAIAAGLAVWYLRPSEPRQLMRFEHYLPEGQQFNIVMESPALAISPDGKQIVYSTPEGLYLRSVEELTAQPIVGAEDNALEPFFSPDGKWIAYFSVADRQLKKIPVNGGSPVKICDVNIITGASWHKDDEIVYGESNQGIMRVSANGGTAEIIVKMESGILAFPQILPDGKSVLYMALDQSNQYRTFVQPLESGNPKELIAGGWASYLPTGHIAYVPINSSTLTAVPFDLDTLEITDGPVQMVDNVRQYSVSSTGTLAYIPGTITEIFENNLVWVDREGNEELLKAESGNYRRLKISPDGTRVALTIEKNGNEDIYVYDLARENMRQITFDEADDSIPLWTLDSKRILFTSNRDDGWGIYSKAADGTGEVELLGSQFDALTIPFSWSSDGKTLIILQINTEFSSDIGMLTLEGDYGIEMLLQEKYMETFPQISPDGSWIAYTSAESGQNEVFVHPFPDLSGGKWKVSTGIGALQRWSWDGRELFYWSSNGKMMAVAVESEPTFNWETPQELFQRTAVNTTSLGLTFIAWDIHPDNKRFLMLRPSTTADEASLGEIPRKINIVLNWFEELKQRVPVQ